jgi:hypothetical protein
MLKWSAMTKNFVRHRRKTRRGFSKWVGQQSILFICMMISVIALVSQGLTALDSVNPSSVLLFLTSYEQSTVSFMCLYPQ